MPFFVLLDGMINEGDARGFGQWLENGLEELTFLTVLTVLFHTLTCWLSTQHGFKNVRIVFQGWKGKAALTTILCRILHCISYLEMHNAEADPPVCFSRRHHPLWLEGKKESSGNFPMSSYELLMKLAYSV
jgi:hypothetical protein